MEESRAELRDRDGRAMVARGRQLLCDLALLALALSILLVPSWLQSASRARLRLEESVLRPISIEINAAPWYEWALLDGIGEVRARQIVAYRKQHGPFGSFDELKAIPGLPRGWVDRARRHLSLAPPARGK